MSSQLLELLYMSFPARLIALRKAKGHTQASLAEASGIHVQQIKRYELGNAQPSIDALIRLAKTLGVSTDGLLFDDAERGPDDALRLQFEALRNFDEDERMVAQELLDSLILKHQARQMVRRSPATERTTPRTAESSRRR